VSQVLSLELSDEVYAALQQQAEITGISLAELVATSIEQQYRSSRREKSQTETEREAIRQRFRSHAGSINLGSATNESNNLCSKVLCDILVVSRKQ